MGAIEDLELKLSAPEIPDSIVDLVADLQGWHLALAGCTLAKDGKADSNWVEQEGGLPEFICEIARAIIRDSGKSTSQAIAIAVGRAKKWAAGGDGVKPDTQAKAAAAVASWEKKKSSAKARPNK